MRQGKYSKAKLDANKPIFSVEIVKINLKMVMRFGLTPQWLLKWGTFCLLRKGRRSKFFCQKISWDRQSVTKEKTSNINIFAYIIKFYRVSRKTKSMQVHHDFFMPQQVLNKTYGALWNALLYLF